jgi:hypothetical protein
MAYELHQILQTFKITHKFGSLASWIELFQSNLEKVGSAPLTTLKPLLQSFVIPVYGRKQKIVERLCAFVEKIWHLGYENPDDTYIILKQSRHPTGDFPVAELIRVTELPDDLPEEARQIITMVRGKTNKLHLIAPPKVTRPKKKYPCSSCCKLFTKATLSRNVGGRCGRCSA